MLDEIQLALIQDLEKLHGELRGIKSLVDTRIPARVRKTEDSLIKSQVITAGSTIDTAPINQENYNRARLFMGVGFGTGAVGDVVVDLYFQGMRVQSVLSVSPQGGSTGATSDSFDVNHLTGFHFVIRNLDYINSVTVKNLRIVLYREGEADE